LTVLEWRGFFGALLSSPFLITVPINGFITGGLENNWRWGMGMFAIMVPALLTPAIVTLYAMQYRGKKLGMVSAMHIEADKQVTMAESKTQRSGTAGDMDILARRGWLRSLWSGIIEIDLFGLILLGFGFALLLLPFTLRKSAEGGWSNPSMIAMLVVGVILIALFALFEIYYAPKPLMTKRIIYNRAFLAAVTVNIFSQMSSSVRNTYFFSYINVITPWTTYQQTIFIGITTMGLCLVGPIVGLLHRRTHRYKTLMVIGNSTKILAYGLLVVSGSNSMTQDTGRLVASQLIFCLGSLR
jgi:MFS family permease